MGISLLLRFYRLTAADFSVVVRNPPKDAYDPDEWREFFSQFQEKQVTLVTVALNNGNLLRPLAHRRKHMNDLRLFLSRGTDVENPSALEDALVQLREQRTKQSWSCFDYSAALVVRILNLFDLFLEPDTLVMRITELEKEVLKQMESKFDVAEVSVTFETEEGQRKALASMCSRYDKLDESTKAGVLFRDQVLRVQRPGEPDVMRWKDLGVPTRHKLVALLVTACVTLAEIVVSVLLVKLFRDQVSAAAAGLVIAALNSIAPVGIKAAADLIERHRTETDFQKSIFVRITLYRWITTVVVAKIITPFLATLEDSDESILPSVSAIMWSELLFVPALRLADLYTNVGKHLAAPRARTQEGMNSYFQGTFYDLGERYTDLTKIMFLVAVVRPLHTNPAVSCMASHPRDNNANLLHSTSFCFPPLFCSGQLFWSCSMAYVLLQR
jgi:hypothetical protein